MRSVPSRRLFEPASRTDGFRGSTAIVAFVCGPGEVGDVDLGSAGARSVAPASAMVTATVTASATRPATTGPSNRLGALRRRRVTANVSAGADPRESNARAALV